MTKSRGIYERHGKRRSAIYNIWCGMIGRCTNQNNRAFANYGGRGITVSEDWLKFSKFYEDMGDRPAGRSLERRDNNQGYSRANCYWATKREQNRNKRDNVLLTIDGETMPLSAWAERYGLRYGTVHQRYYKSGWPADAAVKTPLVKSRMGVRRGDKFFARHGVRFHEQEAA